MDVLKDSCFQQLGEPEVNGDPHEDLIPAPVTGLPLSHLSYSTLLSASFISDIPWVRRKVGTECSGCFFYPSLPAFCLRLTEAFVCVEAAFVCGGR